MSDKTTTFAEVLKAVPLADSRNLNSLYALVMDAAGSPQRRKLLETNHVSLTDAENIGTRMPLKEFTLKYLEKYAPGTMLSDIQSYAASQWFMVLPDGTEVSLQRYVILIVKNRGSLTSNYGYQRFLLLPNSKAEPNMYFICQETSESPDKYSCQIFKVPFEQVYFS